MVVLGTIPSAPPSLEGCYRRIKELEAKVRYHDDRADRAERWVYKIWVEIEQKFFGGDAVRFVERFEPRRASASMEQLLGEHPPWAAAAELESQNGTADQKRLLLDRVAAW